MTKKTLKAKDIERLENTSLASLFASALADTQDGAHLEGASPLCCLACSEGTVCTFGGVCCTGVTCSDACTGVTCAVVACTGATCSDGCTGVTCAAGACTSGTIADILQ